MAIPAQQLERLLPRIDDIPTEQAQALLKALAKEVDAKAREDGLFWLRFVQTRDEADRDHSIKPFPLHEAFTTALWKDFDAHEVVAVAKSRQMFVSWLISCYCVHWARYKPNQAIFFQTQAWPDAVAMTAMPSGGYEGRCQFIETHLPQWMQMDCKFTEGRIQYPNGSIIQALAGGANQIRGKTPSLYVGDEYAFMEDQDKVWTAVAPLRQKGSKIIIVSTPNGTRNMFATLWHGHTVDLD